MFRIAAARKLVIAESRFRILDHIQHGDLVTVFTEGAVRYRAPNGSIQGVDPQRQGFALVRRRGAWRFADESWLRAADSVTLHRDPRTPVPFAAPPKLVTRAQVETYRSGTPARAAIELLRVLQYGDPYGAASYLTKAWHATSAKIARALLSYRGPAQAFRGSIRTLSSSPDRARLRADFKGVPLKVRMLRTGGRWKVAQVRFGTLVEPK